MEAAGSAVEVRFQMPGKINCKNSEPKKTNASGYACKRVIKVAQLWHLMNKRAQTT